MKIFSTPRRIGTVLRWLVLACLLPAATGAAALLSLEYLNGRRQLENDMLVTARAMVIAVDNRLFRALTAAQVMAGVSALAQNDLAEFHRRAGNAIASTNVGLNYVLSDASGQQVVNTLIGFGEALPKHGNPEVLQRVFATGKPVISDIYIGGLLRKPLFSIDVPVSREGKVVYELAIGMLPSEFDNILSGQRDSSDRVMAIFDRSGTVVARTHHPEKYVGQKGATDFVSRMMEAEEGLVDSVTLEGTRTLSAWSRSAHTGWSVGIGIPRASLERDLQVTVLSLALGLAALIGIGLWLARYSARMIADSVRALAAPARAMLAGQSVQTPAIPIQESAEVAEEILQAAKMLAERSAALVAANADLKRLARIDALTGLQNRNSGIENLHLEYRRLKRSGSVYSILFIDIDRFKDINDSYGHHAGDQVLKQVAASLEASLRETDFVARFGGEEFVAILPDTNAEEALPIAEKLRSDIAAQAFPIPIQVTISIGISMACHSDRNAEDAVHRADSALYQAKEGGRNAVRCR